MNSFENNSFENYGFGARLRPESLGDYRLICHFKNRPLFILQYSGTININQIFKEHAQWVVFFKGTSKFAVDEKMGMQSQGHSFLIRLCDHSYADVSPHRIELYADSYKLAQRRLYSLVKEFAAIRETKQPHFHLVTLDRISGCLETSQVTLPNKEFMNERELKLHYGDDFFDWHTQLAERLNVQKHGVSILRGSSGTGKTTYIRSLIAELNKSHFFLFMPVKIGWILNAPETVQFWMEQKQRNPGRKLVAILEDAEHFLMIRGNDNASSASDLLNASDGLLSDFLQMHLICTVNCDVSQLDKAVMRSGRMVAYREFSRLSPAQAKRLADAKHLEIKPKDSYSLAEIYNGAQLQAATKKMIGFEP